MAGSIVTPPVPAASPFVASAAGVQVEVTKTAQEAGIKFPMFLTRAVFNAFVAVPPEIEKTLCLHTTYHRFRG